MALQVLMHDGRRVEHAELRASLGAFVSMLESNLTLLAPRARASGDGLISSLRACLPPLCAGPIDK